MPPAFPDNPINALSVQQKKNTRTHFNCFTLRAFVELLLFTSTMRDREFSDHVHYITSKVNGVFSAITMSPTGSRVIKREVKIVIRCTAEPAVSCCIKILPHSAL